jgi:hypothetical protein
MLMSSSALTLTYVMMSPGVRPIWFELGLLQSFDALRRAHSSLSYHHFMLALMNIWENHVGHADVHETVMVEEETLYRLFVKSHAIYTVSESVYLVFACACVCRLIC